MRNKMSTAQKHRMMSELLRSRSGRARIAANITEPLRTLRDYVSVGRKALLIDELPDGALPIYDMDPDINGFVVGEEASSIQQIVKSDRILVPTFELATYPKVPFTQIRQRRYDVIKRIREKSRSQIFRAEDKLIFEAFDTAATASGVVDSTQNVTSTDANWTGDTAMDTMTNLYSKVERHGLRVDKLYMNAENFKVIRQAGRDYMDFETQRELLKTGYMGTLWGASVYLSPEISAGSVYSVTEPEYLGVLPVQIDLTVLPADDPGNRQLGWSVFQSIGIGIWNAQRGLSKLTISG